VALLLPFACIFMLASGSYLFGYKLGQKAGPERSIPDKEAIRKKAEPRPAQPNRMDQAKQWAFSKWSPIPLIAVAFLIFVVEFIANMKTVLDWFGIKK
jgi:hypothetical protein